MNAMLAGALGVVFGAVGAIGAGQYAAQTKAPSDGEKPAYLVVLGKVKDRQAFLSGYVAKLPPVYSQYGGEYLAVGRNYETLEGEADFESVVISKWPSLEAGRAVWNTQSSRMQGLRATGATSMFFSSKGSRQRQSQSSHSRISSTKVSNAPSGELTVAARNRP